MKEKLLDDERKNNDTIKLKMKEKEVELAPCDEGTSSKSSQSKIDSRTENKIPQRKNQNEGQKKIKNSAIPRNNPEAFKNKDQKRTSKEE